MGFVAAVADKGRAHINSVAATCGLLCTMRELIVVSLTLGCQLTLRDMEDYLLSNKVSPK